jgi:hypothetical protein
MYRQEFRIQPQTITDRTNKTDIIACRKLRKENYGMKTKVSVSGGEVNRKPGTGFRVIR